MIPSSDSVSPSDTDDGERDGVCGFSSTDEIESRDASVEVDDYQCSICGNSGGRWICCDTCDWWYQLKCVQLTSADIKEDINWHCMDCKD